MSLSQPEFAAEAQDDRRIGLLFSSALRKTPHGSWPDAVCRDEASNVYRIPFAGRRPGAKRPRTMYVIMVPTYGGGVAVKKAVPIQVKRFLNDPANREVDSRRHRLRQHQFLVRPTVPPETSSPPNARCPTSTVTNSAGHPEDTLPPCETASVRFFTEQ